MGADRRTPLPVPNGRQSADTRNASEKTDTTVRERAGMAVTAVCMSFNVKETLIFFLC